MRLLNNIGIAACLCLAAISGRAQSNFQVFDSTSEQLFIRRDWEALTSYSMASKDSFDYFGLNYRTGVSLFMLQQYRSATYFLEKALKQNISSDACAGYLHAALLAQGRDLEAGRLKEEYPSTTGDNRFTKWIETVYAEGGLKLSAASQSGNIQYYLLGLTSRLGATTRLWQTLTYLRQSGQPSSFSQYEYFAALPAYLGHHWHLRPSAHWAYTDYNTAFVQKKAVNYDYTIGSIRYNSRGLQEINYKLPGNAHSINTALNISRRIGSVLIEAEPSLHTVINRYHYDYTYTTVGTTDSSLEGTLLGTAPYQESGSGSTADTTEYRYIGQFGAAISYTLPFWKDRILLRAAGIYVWNNQAGNFDFNAYALVKCSGNVWLHLSYLKKEDLPLALNYEGQYFNSGNPVKNRAGVSVQLFPLRKFSTFFTYQYEEQMQVALQQLASFNAFYLTLKFNL